MNFPNRIRKDIWSENDFDRRKQKGKASEAEEEQMGVLRGGGECYEKTEKYTGARSCSHYL